MKLLFSSATPTSEVRTLHTWGTLLFAVAGLVFAGWAVFAATRLSLFDIRWIQLNGELTHNTPTTIRTYALPKLAGNFFTLDLAQAKQAFESVPWVRHAIVQRIWPNRLVVTLAEHRSLAYWHNEDGDDQLVSRTGDIFSANLGDVEDQNLPTLEGPENTAPQMLAVLNQLNQVFAPLSTQVSYLQLSDRGSWRATLENGAEIELGRGSGDELAARVKRFVTTVTQVTAHYHGPLQAADLRYPQGYALRLRGVSTLPAGSSVPASQPRQH